MTLKNATSIAIGCIIFSFLWETIYWVITSFELIEYSKAPWVYKLWIIPTFVQFLGLLIFLTTLRKKQKGNQNG